MGAVRGYTYSADFWQAAEDKKYQIQTVNSDQQNLGKLLAGRIDAFINDSAAATATATATALIKHRLSPRKQALVSVSKYYAIETSVHLLISHKTLQAEQLLSRFNKGLAKIVNNGTYQTISQRYPMIERGFL